MKKLACVLSAVMLTGCFGYQPMYAKKSGDLSRVYVEKVTVSQEEESMGKGQRRVAQLMNRSLKEVFNNNSGDLSLLVDVHENENALAIQRDATEERLELILTVTATLMNNETGKEDLRSVFDVISHYNIQETPYATESGVERARKSAASSAAEEVVHRVSLFLNQENKH